MFFFLYVYWIESCEWLICFTCICNSNLVCKFLLYTIKCFPTIQKSNLKYLWFKIIFFFFGHFTRAKLGCWFIQFKNLTPFLRPSFTFLSYTKVTGCLSSCLNACSIGSCWQLKVIKIFLGEFYIYLTIIKMQFCL